MAKGFSISHNKSERLYFSRPHTHNNYEIFYFLSGDITYYIEGHVYEINPHDLLMINNREIHKPIFHSEALYERIIVNFDESYVKPQFSDYNLTYCFENRTLGHGNKIEGKFVLQHNIHSYFINILECLKNDSIEDQLLAKTYFIQMLLQLNKIFKKENEKFTKGYAKDEKLDQVIHFINSHLSNRLTLDIIQEECFVNKYYLSHLFKEMTGMTVMEYITHKRILLAKNLLQSGMSATDVAHESGFNDYSNFYKSFKRITNQSPTKYKKADIKR